MSKMRSCYRRSDSPLTQLIGKALTDSKHELDLLREVERAARVYYERYCQDEADGWAGADEQQTRDAQALRDALRAAEPQTADPTNAGEGK